MRPDQRAKIRTRFLSHRAVAIEYKGSDFGSLAFVRFQLWKVLIRLVWFPILGVSLLASTSTDWNGCKAKDWTVEDMSIWDDGTDPTIPGSIQGQYFSRQPEGWLQEYSSWSTCSAGSSDCVSIRWCAHEALQPRRNLKPIQNPDWPFPGNLAIHSCCCHGAGWPVSLVLGRGLISLLQFAFGCLRPLNDCWALTMFSVKSFILVWPCVTLFANEIESRLSGVLCVFACLVLEVKQPAVRAYVRRSDCAAGGDHWIILNNCAYQVFCLWRTTRSPTPLCKKQTTSWCMCRSSSDILGSLRLWYIVNSEWLWSSGVQEPSNRQ